MSSDEGITLMVKVLKGYIAIGSVIIGTMIIKTEDYHYYQVWFWLVIVFNILFIISSFKVIDDMRK